MSSGEDSDYEVGKKKKKTTTTPSSKTAKKSATTKNTALADVAVNSKTNNSNNNNNNNNNNMSIEKTYQKKTQLEHILLRPDTYIGSVERVEQDMWVWNFSDESMQKRSIKYVPGLLKIFDEILVNAADNKQRDSTMSVIKVTIKKEENMIKVFNDGQGIPIVEHQEEKLMIPTMIFGHLLTSSNYDDDQKKVTGGRNGYGAKLCNIFSTKFQVETQCSQPDIDKSFKQTWSANMSKADKPKVNGPAKGSDFTSVTFWPDLAKFSGMSELEDDTIALLARRAYDVAASTRGIKVFLNGKRLPINKFEDYCKLYVSKNSNQNHNNEIESAAPASPAAPAKILYESPNARWEVAVSVSDIGFQQVSFVNSIACTKGGRHVDYVCDQVVKSLCETVNKKSNKNAAQCKPFQIKQHLWLFVNCQIENPVFESQTKETMSSQVKNFGSKCVLSEEYLKRVAQRSGIVDRVLNWMAFKEKTDLEKTGAKSKQSKIKGIPKLDDANNAGTKDSLNCTLILTEGDSAKSLAVAGLGVIGRDRYGVFPLRGKLLNVREATSKQTIDNAEVSALLKIIGLSFKEKYEAKESLRLLRYGKVMIMTDQDHDGSHIKGLIINFFHYQWPNLLRHGFLEQFITPIIKVYKTIDSRMQEKSFYSMPEFEEWQQQNEKDTWQTWKIKYYKGLGTSTSREAKEYFSNMERHCIRFEYAGLTDDLAIQLAFSKRLIEDRKEWLSKFMESKRTENESNSISNSNNNSSKVYLYQKDTKQINYTEFVNKELVYFSNLDNERSIPSVVDGMKPGQRKVLYACFKRNLHKEIKVAQLAGSVAELSCYHHGEASLMGTIINLAQNYVGSNNLNMLLPIGQFGTRLHGGKDAASPRYIFTSLSQLTRMLFNVQDDPILDYLSDDGQRVEPQYYVPILPLVLVNGAEGIGTGWAVKIPNYSVRDVVNNLTRMIKREKPFEMKPFYKNFIGEISRLDASHFLVSGEIALLDYFEQKKSEEGQENGSNSNSKQQQQQQMVTVEISELPVGVWTQAYKENVLEPYLTGESNTGSSDKDTSPSSQHQHQQQQQQNQPLISAYKEYHTDCTVRFLIKMTRAQYKHALASSSSLHKFFKLQKTLATTNMVLFDSNGCLKRYESPLDILGEFFAVRRSFYVKRKEFAVARLSAEAAKLNNLARFVAEKCASKIKVENLKKVDLIRLLGARGYKSDPIRKWKEKIIRERGYLDDANNNSNSNSSKEGSKVTYRGEGEGDQEEEDEDEKETDFNYLLGMPLWNLTLEKKEEIERQARVKQTELDTLQAKSCDEMWLADLAAFKTKFEELEQNEKIIEQSSTTTTTTTATATATTSKRKMKPTSTTSSSRTEHLPSKDGERVEPRVDAQLLAKCERDAQLKLLAKLKQQTTTTTTTTTTTDETSFDGKSKKSLSITDVITMAPNTSSSGSSSSNRKQEIEELAFRVANPLAASLAAKRAAQEARNEEKIKKKKKEQEMTDLSSTRNGDEDHQYHHDDLPFNDSVGVVHFDLDRELKKEEQEEEKEEKEKKKTNAPNATNATNAGQSKQIAKETTKAKIQTKTKTNTKTKTKTGDVSVPFVKEEQTEEKEYKFESDDDQKKTSSSTTTTTTTSTTIIAKKKKELEVEAKTTKTKTKAISNANANAKAKAKAKTSTEKIETSGGKTKAPLKIIDDDDDDEEEEEGINDKHDDLNSESVSVSDSDSDSDSDFEVTTSAKSKAKKKSGSTTTAKATKTTKTTKKPAAKATKHRGGKGAKKATAATAKK